MSGMHALKSGDKIRVFGLGDGNDGCSGTLVCLQSDGWLVAHSTGDESVVCEDNLIASPDYDSDEDYCARRVAKRQRTSQADTPPQGVLFQKPRGQSFEQQQQSAGWQVLTCSFPAGCACSENAPIYKIFKSLEKYELAVQCDDHGDSELRAFNSEALLYGRSAAVVAGLSEPLSRGSSSKAAFLERLIALPFFGPFRAAQVYEILTIGACEALRKFDAGLPPTGSDGVPRLMNDASRSLRHAPEKRALGKVFGMGNKTAIDLVESTGRFEGMANVMSVGHLLCSPAHLAKLRADSVGRDGVLMASLTHYDELQEDVSEAEAETMRTAVLSVVRQQHSQRVGATRDCPPPASPGERCTCCWHAEFVGGTRTTGRAGHDVDLLLWHHTEPNSWGEGAQQCVLLPLVSELFLDDDVAAGALRVADAVGSSVERPPSARAGLLPKRMGRCQIVRRAHAEKQRRHPDGAPCYLPAPPSQQGGAKGIENLQGDWHDKERARETRNLPTHPRGSLRASALTFTVGRLSSLQCMGLWRNGDGRHRRIDIVVVATPEELPFARLTWTGSRTLNRLLRYRAIHLGLHLTANGIVARPPNGVSETLVLVDDRPGRDKVEVVVRGHGQVPTAWTRTEEDIIRILANGTDAFAGVYDPLMRNA